MSAHCFIFLLGKRHKQGPQSKEWDKWVMVQYFHEPLIFGYMYKHIALSKTRTVFQLTIVLPPPTEFDCQLWAELWVHLITRETKSAHSSELYSLISGGWRVLGIICLLFNILFNRKKNKEQNHLVSAICYPETCVSMGIKRFIVLPAITEK